MSHGRCPCSRVEWCMSPAAADWCAAWEAPPSEHEDVEPEHLHWPDTMEVSMSSIYVLLYSYTLVNFEAKQKADMETTKNNVKTAASNVVRFVQEIQRRLKI